MHTIYVRKFQGKDKYFYLLKESLESIEKASGHPLIIVAILSGWLHRLPFVTDYIKQIVRGWYEVENFLKEEIDKHKSRLDAYEDSEPEPQDFIDTYILEQRRLDAIGEHHYYRRVFAIFVFALTHFFFFFSDKQMLNMTADLFLAGQETTSSTLTWGFGFLIHNPDVQSHVHEELDAIIGSDRAITMADRNNLPYTCATINEIHR